MDITLGSSQHRRRTMTTNAIDPVCGMIVEPEEADGESDYQGQTYYFCCAECKRIFDEDPTNFVSEQTADHATLG
jgi:YHS domain-containing protein